MRLIWLLSVSVLFRYSTARAQTVPRLPWKLRWDMVAPLNVPAAMRHSSEYTSMISDLEYFEATDTVKGVRVDLNRDGVMDYIIQSAPSLCGTGGCGYAIFDGARHKSLGEVGRGTLYFLADKVRGYPTIVSVTSIGGAAAEYTTCRFNGDAYVEVSKREVKTGTRDSLDSVLGRIPAWRPPSRR